MEFRCKSPFDCILFDLDDTLYSSTTGLAQVCKRNIEDFLVEKCGFPVEKASDLRIELFRTYGSTLAGLRALGYDIDADDYHSFVHGTMPYERIKPDVQLRSMIQSIMQRKIVRKPQISSPTRIRDEFFFYFIFMWYHLEPIRFLSFDQIFTNSDRIHARRALQRLDLEDCFDDIICFETLNPNLFQSNRPDEFPVLLKPSMDAMKIALDVAGSDPTRTLFLDDNDRNISAGKALGLRTALVGKSVKTMEADYLVESISSLDKVIPEIWEYEEEGIIARTRSEMESMLEATPVGA
ncbi:putative Protein SSM1 [Cinnamomum micranthum f. kanehirae]|uniref:Uncharacterized protein n=1 Tax=Cinnamomum micranthum f. kanehirae TaxID=337451 RepID=A0A3S3N4M0_9MAGN|nr:putative Protein SSM1 [Cinnamomum micranthum f. kanehirae]